MKFKAEPFAMYNGVKRIIKFPASGVLDVTDEQEIKTLKASGLKQVADKKKKAEIKEE